MKTSNYLIALAALTSFTFVSCSDNDFVDTAQVVPSEQTNGEITFAANNAKLTRADIVGGTAAGMLGNTFVVEGTKGSEQTNSPSTKVVFDNYVVKYGANTAGTTESNTNNWEYVGQTHAAIGTNTTTQINRTINEQTIKYWDQSTDQYDFIAYSTGNKTMVAGTDYDTETELSAGKISVTKILTGTDLSTAAYRFIGTSVEDLSDCYITDITPVLKAKYNNVVTLKFKNITSKVRVGLYETVPGYSVKDVKFYYDDATDIATGPVATSSGLAGGAEKATLFTPSGKSIPQSGTITVKYPHIGTTSGPAGTNEADYNKASVSVAAGDKSSPYLAFGELTNNYTTAERNEAAGSIYLGRSLPMATFAGESAKNYYTPVLPNTSGENLTLRVDYTLVSTDGSAETIVIHGAKAVIPSTYTQWLNNYAYTYIFKITDNTNGWTSTVTSDPNGLFPITFDAVVKEMVDYDGEQTTVTTVATPSITTYQQGHVYTTDEYAKSPDKDIYVQVMDNKTSTPSLVKTLADGNSLLYKVEKNNTDYKASEAEVMDALLKQWSVDGDNIKGRNSVQLTKIAIANDVTSIVNGVNDDAITVDAGSAAMIDISGLAVGTYAYVYDYTTGDKTVVAQYQQIAATAGTTVVTGYYGLPISEIPSSPEASGKANADYIYLSKTYNGAANPTWTQVTVVNGESGTDVTGLYKVAKTTVLAGKVSSAATTAAENTLYFDVYNENNGKYAVKVIKIVASAATTALTASKNTVTAPSGTSTITYRENGKAVVLTSPTITITKKGKLSTADGGFDTWRTDVTGDGAVAATTASTDQATCINNNDGTYTFTGKVAGIYRVNINGVEIDITVN